MRGRKRAVPPAAAGGTVAGPAVAVAVVVALLLLAGCAKQNTREWAPAGDGAGAQSVNIDLINNVFAPRNIGVRPGQPLTVQLRNKGLSTHTFTMRAQGVDAVLDPGEERRLTIPIPGREGMELYFLCRFHDASGMHGRVGVGTTSVESES